jgi:predicted phage terminase large subunit-like protein
MDIRALQKLTPAQQREQLIAAKRILAIEEARSPDGLLPFTRLMKPDPEDVEDPDLSMYQVAPPHRLLAQALTKVVKRENLRLMISMPPQHGKSDMGSRSAPAFIAGQYPWANIMMGTYNQDFANEFGDDVRALLQSPIYHQIFPNTRLRTGSKAKDHMVTTAGGKFSFLGRGGSGTGRPADFFLIDDPIKDAKEAGSLTIRNDVWDWFTRVANTRCHSLSAQVIIQTRWSDDDLIGRLVDPSNPHSDAEIAKHWTYINIPAIMDNEDIARALGKEIGDALWPERFGLPLLENARRMDPVGFSALYQGRPTPLEGAFYKAENIHTYQRGQLPGNLRIYGSGDLAVSPEIYADHSAVGNWGLDENDDLWLLPELYWEKKSADESVEQIIDFGKQYKWLTFFGEKGVIDRSVGPFLRKRMQERGVHFHIETFPTTGSKATRSTSIRGRMAMGKVHFPGFAPWWTRAKEQLLKFTGSGDDTEDDFADMIGMIGQGMGDQIKASAPSDKGNVIYPKVGTFGWTVARAKQEAAQKKARTARKGF